MIWQMVVALLHSNWQLHEDREGRRHRERMSKTCCTAEDHWCRDLLYTAAFGKFRVILLSPTFNISAANFSSVIKCFSGLTIHWLHVTTARPLTYLLNYTHEREYSIKFAFSTSFHSGQLAWMKWTDLTTDRQTSAVHNRAPIDRAIYQSYYWKHLLLAEKKMQLQYIETTVTINFM